MRRDKTKPPSVDKRKVARHATNATLVDPPGDVLTIKTYANTDFVNIVVKKPLYDQLDEKVKRLETTPDKLIYNALLLILKET